MDEPDFTTLLELLVSSHNALLATKYLAGSASVILIYDALLTFDQELLYIWALPPRLTNIVFIFIRYVTMGSLVYTNYMLSGFGNPTDLECKAFLITLCALSMIYSVTANAFIAFRLYALWDQRRSVKVVLGVLLVVTYVPMFVTGGISAVKFYKSTFVIDIIHACIVTQEDVLTKVVFGCMFAFDVTVVVMAVFNALDRPRGPQHKLLDHLRRDGSLWFLGLSLLRLLNFVVFLLLIPEQAFVVIFMSWALLSVTLSRMILRVEAVKRPPKSRLIKVKTWCPPNGDFQLEEWSRGSHTNAV